MMSIIYKTTQIKLLYIAVLLFEHLTSFCFSLLVINEVSQLSSKRILLWPFLNSIPLVY